MKSNACYLCKNETFSNRPGIVRDNTQLEILECLSCGLVFLSETGHISEQHYVESGMHDGISRDIREWLKDTVRDDERRLKFVKEKIQNSSLLDFGCGAGGFLEFSKNITSKCAGVELEKALQASYAERGLKVYTSLKEALDEGEKWDVITAFHVIEHLPDPKPILKNLASLLKKGGEIIIEVPSSNDALLTLFDSQAFQKFTYWSQHLFLYNESTLSTLVKQSGLKVKWSKHIQRYPLSNHLHWLAKQSGGGHKEWSFLNDDLLDKAYENQLASLGLTDTLIMSIER